MSEHPLEHAALGLGLDPEMPKHVQALGSVMHGVGGDVRHDSASSESIRRLVPLPLKDIVEGTQAGTDPKGLHRILVDASKSIDARRLTSEIGVEVGFGVLQTAQAA